MIYINIFSANVDKWRKMRFHKNCRSFRQPLEIVFVRFCVLLLSKMTWRSMGARWGWQYSSRVAALSLTNVSNISRQNWREEMENSRRCNSLVGKVWPRWATLACSRAWRACLRARHDEGRDGFRDRSSECSAEPNDGRPCTNQKKEGQKLNPCSRKNGMADIYRERSEGNCSAWTRVVNKSGYLIF